MTYNQLLPAVSGEVTTEGVSSRAESEHIQAIVEILEARTDDIANDFGGDPKRVRAIYHRIVQVGGDLQRDDGQTLQEAEKVVRGAPRDSALRPA